MTNTVSFSKTNRLIRKSVMRMFPACFAATLAGSVILMIDSLLAGAMISEEAIAAVAIGNPITGIFRALILCIGNGAAVRLAISVGRSDKVGSGRAHSFGIIGSFVLGFVFTLISFVFADFLVLPFGGAGNPEAAAQAALYLRASALMVLGSSLNIYFGKLLPLYGYQRESFVVSFAGMLLNILTSILFVKILPSEMAIAGLGIGTCIGSATSLLMNFIILRVRRIPLQFRFHKFKLGEMLDILKLGFPSSSNNLIEGIASGVVNNIILAGFGGDTMALSIYTAVKSIFGFASSPALSTTLSTSPLFGLLYGARDKNGIRRTLGEGFKLGLLFNAAWCGILLALLPILMQFFGMPDNPIVRTGVYITFAFIPAFLILRVMTTLFESTEKPGMGLLYSILPDSVIYPIMLWLLLPVLGYNGIWISYGANGIVFMIGLYLIRSVKNKTPRMTVDRLLSLDESIRDHVPMLDISITPSMDLAGQFSADVQAFMTKTNASARDAYMTALCLEELIADFALHTASADKAQEIMDIKIFSDEDRYQIILRNAAKPYNPLDHLSEEIDSDKTGVRMVQQVAKHIEYAYVFRMNVITIDLAK